MRRQICGRNARTGAGLASKYKSSVTRGHVVYAGGAHVEVMSAKFGLSLTGRERVVELKTRLLHAHHLDYGKTSILLRYHRSNLRDVARTTEHCPHLMHAECACEPIDLINVAIEIFVV